MAERKKATKRKLQPLCATHRSGLVYISCKGPLDLLHAVKAKRDLEQAIGDQICWLEDHSEPVEGGC